MKRVDLRQYSLGYQRAMRLARLKMSMEARLSDKRHPDYIRGFMDALETVQEYLSGLRIDRKD